MYGYGSTRKVTPTLFNFDKIDYMGVLMSLVQKFLVFFTTSIGKKSLIFATLQNTFKA